MNKERFAVIALITIVFFMLVVTVIVKHNIIDILYLAVVVCAFLRLRCLRYL